jgi:hypothetical protein
LRDAPSGNEMPHETHLSFRIAVARILVDVIGFLHTRAQSFFESRSGSPALPSTLPHEYTGLTDAGGDDADATA